jgi:hypothetical protein
LSCDGTFVAGAVADAAPVIARETPAAPNAKAAFLDKAAFLLFLLELRFACVMVDPPHQRFGTRTSFSAPHFSALRHEPARCRFGSAWPDERRRRVVLAFCCGRARWAGIRSANPQLFDGLAPTVSLSELPPSNRRELRLVVGPIASADAAARLCTTLERSRPTYQSTIFAGPHLTLD